MGKIVITPESMASWAWMEPSRLAWWLDLLMLAATDDADGVKKGDVKASLGELAKRWNVSRYVVRRYLESLERHGEIRHNFGTDVAQLTICNYESYTIDWHKDGTKVAQQGKKTKKSGTKLAQPTTCVSADSDECRHNNDTKSEIEQKEKKKKEPKKEVKKNNYVVPVGTPCPNPDGLELSPSRTRKEEALKEEVAQQKTKNIITRAREKFEDLYRQAYGDEYYWEAKDAANMKKLLDKIAYSRRHRASPLPTDDDSLIDAFGKFLLSINKEWIAKNFSVTKINSQYNEIISEIKRGNGKSVVSNSGGEGQGGLQSASARQKEHVLSDLSEAERKWREGWGEGY